MFPWQVQQKSPFCNPPTLIAFFFVHSGPNYVYVLIIDSHIPKIQSFCELLAATKRRNDSCVFFCKPLFLSCSIASEVTISNVATRTKISSFFNTHSYVLYKHDTLDTRNYSFFRQLFFSASRDGKDYRFDHTSNRRSLLYWFKVRRLKHGKRQC